MIDARDGVPVGHRLSDGQRIGRRAVLDEEGVDAAGRLRRDPCVAPLPRSAARRVDAVAGGRVEDGDTVFSRRRDSGFDVVGTERDGVEPFAMRLEMALERGEPGRFAWVVARSEQLDVAALETKEDIGSAVGRVPSVPGWLPPEQPLVVRGSGFEIAYGDHEMVQREAAHKAVLASTSSTSTPWSGFGWTKAICPTRPSRGFSSIRRTSFALRSASVATMSSTSRQT